MFVPLYDYNPLKRIETPYVTLTLIVVTVLVFVVFQSGYLAEAEIATIAGFSLVPSELIRPVGLRGNLGVVPEPLTVVSYMFLHGGWMHLFGNMLFLWVFGDNIEDAVGHLKFLGFYLLCGVAAGLAHTLFMSGSQVPLVGASGAVAGCLSAYLILHPRVKVWCLFLGRIPLKVTAVWAIGAWIVFQFFAAFVLVEDMTAWWAHIGGIVAGAVLIPFMRHPDVPLFDRGLKAP